MSRRLIVVLDAIDMRVFVTLFFPCFGLVVFSFEHHSSCSSGCVCCLRVCRLRVYMYAVCSAVFACGGFKRVVGRRQAALLSSLSLLLLSVFLQGAIVNRGPTIVSKNSYICIQVVVCTRRSS